MYCRLCVHECSENNAIELFNNLEETQLTKQIAKYLYLEVTQSDTFSTILCKICLQHLNDFHKFFQYVEQRQKELNDNFLEIKLVVGSANYESPHENKILDNTFHTEPNEESLLDIKDVIIEEQNADIEKFLPEEEFGYASLECNDVESDNEDDLPLQNLIKRANVKRSTRIKNTKNIRNTTKGVKKVKIKKTKEKSCKVKKPSEDEVTLVNTKAKEEKDETTQYSNGEEEEETKDTTEDDNLRDEFIAKNIQLKCEICETIMETFKDLVGHFRKEHKRRAYISCCGMRFRQRFLLVDHIQTHLNPDHFKCKLCGKLLKSRVCLEVHKSNKHSDRQQQKHVCNVCNKRFSHLSLLTTHMNVHTNQRNHVCEICKKGYKTSHVLKAHINHMHGERTPYVCDICGKEYRFKLSFDRHVAEHQGIPIENKKCPVCGKWVSSNYIKRHMNRHVLEDVNCEICGKTVKSRTALQSHIQYCHGTKQIYPCTYCDKTFERPRYLKEHIDMHTGQKDYNCPHCPREFRSKANMYAHVKKAHFEQWTQAQLARSLGCSQKVNSSIEPKINSPFK